jgi:hypothetical protein
MVILSWCQRNDSDSTELQMHIGLPSICSAADIMVAISKKNPANKKFKPHMTIMKVNITWIGHVLFSLIFFSVLGRCYHEAGTNYRGAY